MARDLIENFCRLITSDTDGCLALFHQEAVLVARIGSEEVEVEGRSKIRAFLDMTPSFLKYELKGLEENAGFLVASIEIQGAHRGGERYRFFVDDGLIRRLEMTG